MLELFAQVTAPVSAGGSEALSTRELWSAAVGIFLPLLIAIPMQPGWPTWVRSVVGVICIVIAAFGTAYLDGALAFSGIDAVLRSVLLVAIASWSSYQSLWRHTVAPQIEAAVLNVDQSERPNRSPK